LATELKTREPATAQLFPEQVFAASAVAPQTTGYRGASCNHRGKFPSYDVCLQGEELVPASQAQFHPHARRQPGRNVGRAPFSHWEKVPAERADEGLRRLGVSYRSRTPCTAIAISSAFQHCNPSSVALRAPPSPYGRRSPRPLSSQP
jgi:hypothetical protein